MDIQVSDLRNVARFSVVERISGSFGAADVFLLNLSTAGLQVSHPQPLRIGSRARLIFRSGEVQTAQPARVLWSHLSKTPDADGRLLYESGLLLEAPDGTWGDTIHHLLKRGALRQDIDSLERKKRREIERLQRRAIQPKTLIPTAGGNGTD